MSHPPCSGRLRRGRISRPGGVYHITKCCRHGAGLSLIDPQVAPVLIDSIKWHHDRNHARLLAFVIMPDHVHWLLVLGRERTLDGVMYGFSSVTWQELAPLLRPGLRTFWQEGYHDHQLRAGEPIGKTATYIQANPVRKGLCGAAEEWPWSTACEPYSGWV